MTTDERRRPAVGAQIRRWRGQRGLTLANVAERSGLNIGYLSQIENDKATPSLQCLAAIGEALGVPAAWFLIDDVPQPFIVRAAERPVSEGSLGRVEQIDGRGSRDVSIVEVTSTELGQRVEAHAHAGEEHHLVLRGTFRMTQGDHVIDLGPGDYVRWDGTVPHDAEATSEGGGSMLIIRIRPTG